MDTRFWCLDEATSSLDILTELWTHLMALDKTIIFIAHQVNGENGLKKSLPHGPKVVWRKKEAMRALKKNGYYSHFDLLKEV